MSNYSVRISRNRQCISEINKLANTLSQISGEIKSVTLSKDYSMAECVSRIKDIGSRLGQLSTDLQLYDFYLEDATKIYNDAEAIIIRPIRAELLETAIYGSWYGALFLSPLREWLRQLFGWLKEYDNNYIKSLPKDEPKIEPKVEPKIDPKVEPKVEPRVQPKAEPKIEPKKESTIKEFAIASVVYDALGLYGGRQQGPQFSSGQERKELYSIIEKNRPGLSDSQKRDLLIKLNDEGCGYVVIVNTIFTVFQGREAEFKERFGFDMYGGNGDLNYNKLLVDLYSETDNIINEGDVPVYNENEDVSATDGIGTTSYSRKYRTSLYLNRRGVNVSYQIHKDITLDNFSELAKDGQVIISFYNGNMKNAATGSNYYVDGGHSMTVTGITDDRRFIVSSWGEKYYIDPYEIVRRNDKSTTFYFDYVQYS